MLTSRSDAGTSVTSRPAMTIRPLVGASSPAIIRSVVVLPQPLGPSSVVSVPRATRRLTAATTSGAPASP